MDDRVASLLALTKSLVKRVDTRMIAATNRNLLTQVAQGAFREDLYYRINVMHIPVPPLRERSEDVLELIASFFARFAAQYKRPAPTLGPETAEFLRSYAWPGNVRQLKNVAERLVLRDATRPLTIADLPREITEDALTMAAPVPASVDPTRPDRFDRLLQGESFWTAVYPLYLQREITRSNVRDLVRKGLEEARGNYKIVARLFNMEQREYKRFLNFLRKHDCQLPFKEYR